MPTTIVANHPPRMPALERLREDGTAAQPIMHVQDGAPFLAVCRVPLVLATHEPDAEPSANWSPGELESIGAGCFDPSSSVIEHRARRRTPPCDGSSEPRGES